MITKKKKRNDMKVSAIVVSIFFSLIWTATLQADVYTWTDENGVKHYSNEPPDQDNVEVKFKEQKGDQPAVREDQESANSQQEEMNRLIREIEADQQREEAEQRRKARAAQKNQAPSRKQRIAAEEKRLSDKIAELEEKPLDQFGSAKNKRSRIGFYKYRLETLRRDPDKYFNEPERFEGNVIDADGPDASN
jgi:hypothetical protein